MLLEEENINVPAWLSFNSKDGINVVSGDSMTECAAVAESSDNIVAVGINCTPPRFIRDLVLLVKKVSYFLLFNIFFCSGFHSCATLIIWKSKHVFRQYML